MAKGSQCDKLNLLDLYELLIWVCCWLWTLCHTIQHGAVLIILPLNLQTITITRMLSSRKVRVRVGITVRPRSRVTESWKIRMQAHAWGQQQITQAQHTAVLAKQTFKIYQWHNLQSTNKCTHTITSAKKISWYSVIYVGFKPTISPQHLLYWFYYIILIIPNDKLYLT